MTAAGALAAWLLAPLLLGAGAAALADEPAGAKPLYWYLTRLPASAFGHVPTPAIVAPIEFTLPVADYEALRGLSTKRFRCRKCSWRPAERRTCAAGMRRTPGRGSRWVGAKVFCPARADAGVSDRLR